jgi:amino acid adenylation domain-containing protein/non-ribosomal peptide synthase protein (TIGR01720 family)
MTAIEFLSYLRAKDVKLWADGDRLRYSAPNGLMTADLRAQIVDRKSDLLSFLSKAEIAARKSVRPLRKTSREGRLPLTYAQRSLWLLHQLEPDRTAYNIHGAVRLSGRLSVEALLNSLSEIVRRHEALRTNIFVAGGEPQQLIGGAGRLPTVITDLGDTSEAEREKMARSLAGQEALRPFDLARDPLFRSELLRLGEREHILLLTMHHVISDGWSIGILTRELAALYQSYNSGVSSGLAELPIQYADFAVWQYEWLRTAEMEGELAYWKKILEGAPRELDLPSDRARSEAQTFQGGAYAIELPATLSKAIVELARAEGATPFMALLAGFSTLLSQYAGREDIVVGTPLAGRNQVDIEGLIGLFVNVIVLRADLSGDPTFKELLARMQEVVSGGLANQNLPFERLVAELQPDRSLGRMPLAQIGFAFQVNPQSAPKLPDLILREVPARSGDVQTDLILFMWDRDGCLKGSFEYNAGLFEASTVGGIAAHFQLLLEHVVANRYIRISELPQPRRLIPANASGAQAAVDIFELSNLTRNQLLIWAGQKLKPDAPVYVNVCITTFIGKIDLRHFQKAFQCLIDSSDTMRLVIEEVIGVPQQRPLDALKYEMEVLDFCALPDPHRRLRSWIKERSQLSFDLAECLFDSVLIRMSDAELVWYFNQHHSVGDAWAVSLLLKYMSDFYDLSLEESLGRREAPPPFLEYVAQERTYRSTSQYAQDARYWKEKLSEELDGLEFYGNPAVKPTTRCQRIYHDIGPERTGKLQALAARDCILAKSVEASLFNIFGAMLCVYLSHASRARRISFGAAFHNRLSERQRDTIGLFMHILPLHVSLRGNDTLLSLIRQVEKEARATLRHRHYAVENSVQRPGYEVALNFQKVNFQTFKSVSTLTEWYHPGHGSESLTLIVQDFNLSGSFQLGFEFHCDVFDEEQRALAIKHFMSVLDAFLDDINQPVSHVSLLTEEERQCLLHDFNQSDADFSLNRTFSQLFEAQSQKGPDRVAVLMDDLFVSYGRLNARANFVARRLLAPAAGPIVGVLARRGLDLLTGIIAVFKTGVAYVPLDPLYPRARLLEVVRQSEVGLILTTEEFLGRVSGVIQGLPAEGQPTVKLIDHLALSEEKDEQNSDHLPDIQRPGNLAYVIYTSGSTGVPKGAMVEQLGMVNHLYAKISDLGISDGDVVVETASQCFDISVWQFLSALVVGGSVAIAGDDAAHDPKELVALVERQGIAILEVVPSLLQAMMPVIRAYPTGHAALATLRWLLVTGEAMPLELCRDWLETFPNIPLMNAYGPTECSDDVTHYPMSARAPIDQLRTPIGRPVANIGIYILDDMLMPVPVGVPGELCVGGVGVGRGYHGKPAATAEGFRPNALQATDGSRIYKTGDLARFKRDGNIEFLGRLDHQVKIRGYRIELGEIEALLCQHPEIREAVVLGTEDERQQKRLVAYVVSTAGLDTQDYRSYLQARLPDYMIPTQFVILDKLPLTANGKLDRKALPDAGRPSTRGGYVPPKSPAEQVLVEIWREALGLERVSVTDNFFELGGDSILSIRVVVRANEAGFRLTPKQLFKYQTITELAASAGIEVAVDAAQGPIAGAAPLVPIQRWFFEQHLVDPHHYNQAVMLELRQPINAAILREAVRRLVLHHDGLRLRFVEHDSGCRQFFAAPDSTVPFHQLDLSAIDTDQQKGIETAAAELQASLDLSNGPLLRVAMVDLGLELPARLLLIAHHLVIDGVSWRILLEDLQRGCLHLMRGQRMDLPAKTTSFKRWAERLSLHARSPEVRSEIDYWLNESQTKRLPLPGSNNGLNDCGAAKTFSISLDSERTSELLKEVPRVYRTEINDVLLTALTMALSNRTDSSRILIDLEGHGREDLFGDVDLSRTVGWFTSAFPVALGPARVSNPGDSLKTIKEQLRRVPNHGIGYGLLRYMSEDEELMQRFASRPRAEVVFNYFGQLDQLLTDSPLFLLAGESVGPTRSPRGTRSHLLEINCRVAGGNFRADFTYNENFDTRARIEDLGETFIEALDSIISHCLSPEAGGRTPSDFPLVKITQHELDRLIGTGSNIDDVYPLSPMQRDMLLQMLSSPGSDLGVITLAYSFRGTLNLEALEWAWEQVQYRHPILRTAFVHEGLGQPLQLVFKDPGLPWVYHDLRTISAHEQKGRLAEARREDRAQGFESDKPPLMRIAVFRTGDAAYEIMWTVHHILADGWCQGLVLKEVLAFYHSYKEERLRLEPPRPYRDYIDWVTNKDLAAAEQFWRGLLKGIVAPTPIVIDKSPGNITAPGVFDFVEVNLSRATTDALQAMSHRNKLTLSTIVQGAWAVVLARYSGHEDVVFGVTVSGRTPELKGIESIVGLFINNLPVRARIPADSSSLSWLKKLQSDYVDLREYEFTPQYWIQEWSDVPWSLPLYESIVVFENYPVDQALAGDTFGFEFKEQFGTRTSRPLTLLFEPGPELLSRIIYYTGRFDAPAITRMQGHLTTVLAHLALEPERKLRDLPILTNTEAQQILMPLKEPVPRRRLDLSGEVQAKRMPDAVALRIDGAQITFRELARRASQMANYLRRLGVGPEARILICMPHSMDLAVGMLGVFRSDGAFVLSKPVTSGDELTSKLRRFGCSLALTGSGVEDLLPDLRARIVCLHSAGQNIALESSENSEHRAIEESLACLICSSDDHPALGIDRRSLADLVEKVSQTGLTNRGHLAGQAALGPALAWLEVLAAIAGCASPGRGNTPQNGAEPEFVHYDPPEVPKAQHKGRRLVDTAWRDVAEFFYCLSPGYVLDSNLNPLPLGVTGSLYTRGGLVRGYLDKPELTAEAFTPNPFEDVPGTRLYTSGELARYLSDGHVELLGGRLDQRDRSSSQFVLGWIESLINRNPSVKEAVVTTRPGAALTGNSITAYIVPEANSILETEEIRVVLKESLPPQMTPSVFLILDEFPFTPDGKVDREALAASEAGRIRAAKPFKPPRNNLEFQLAKAWEDILGICPISVTENFFDLGANSLLAVRLMAHIQRVFGQTLPLSMLFQEGSIEQISRALERKVSQAQLSPLVLIQRGGPKAPLFCVHPGSGLVLAYSHLARYLGSDRPFYGMQDPQVYEEGEPNASVEEMAARYLAAIESVWGEGPYLLAGWSFGGYIAFEMAQQLIRQNRSVALLALFDTPAPDFQKHSLGDADDAELLAIIASAEHPEHIGQLAEELRKLSPDSQFIHVMRFIEEHRGYAENEVTFIRRQLKVFKSRVEVMKKYTLQRLPVNIVLFRATEGDISAPDDGSDLTLGWSELSTYPVQIRNVPGNHDTMVFEPHVKDLGQQLRASLDAL